MTDALNDKTNDEFYTEHHVGSNYFTLKQKDGDKRLIQKARNIFTNLKTDPK